MNIFLQRCTPQHALSRLMGLLANCRCCHLKNWAIKQFIAAYGVDLSESLESDYTAFPSFNAFFTRALKPGARDFSAPEAAVISPVDGAVSEFGVITEGKLLQAKGQDYSAEALLGSAVEASTFQDGTFITLYLAPKDYHRVHMPFGGRLRQMRYIPGKLFSVNPAAVNGIPGLFAKNERVVCHFDTAFGPMVVILVGAMIVASMHLQWCGQVAPQRSRHIVETDYSHEQLSFERGEEIGHFQLGSTVILLLPNGVMDFNPDLSSGQSIRLGNVLGVGSSHK